jgi:sialidase-1
MANTQTPYIRRLDLWQPDGTYSNHRIPGMLVTDKGTLIAYCEARRDASDWALMDILMQRSEDHGVSFSAKTVLATGTQEHPTVNNPVMMQDHNGRIHFLYCEDYTINGGRVLRRYSDDDGVTWSDPIDITSFTNPQYRNVFALGPGHGITLKDGTLLVPVWMVPKKYEVPLSKHSPSVISTFYSKDCGNTWALGEILDITPDVICPNETVAAQMSDGGVYLNIRHQSAQRANAFSANGYSDWTDYAPKYDLWDPQCFGSVAAYDDGNNPYSIIFANCNNKDQRTHVTVRVSTDDGRSYSCGKLIDADRGGYVDVAVDNGNGLIYVLYEDKYGITDHLVVCNYAWITK